VSPNSVLITADWFSYDPLSSCISCINEENGRSDRSQHVQQNTKYAMLTKNTKLS